MTGANLYIRNNGSFGSSCDGCADTGHYLIEDSGRFTVYSVHDRKEGAAIAHGATREAAEKAIAEDWGSA